MKHKKRSVRCMKKVLWLIERVTVDCEVSCWRFLAGRCSTVEADQLKLLVHKQGHWEQSTFTIYEVADILKISTLIKVLVKKKNMSFILWKTPYGLFWPMQYYFPKCVTLTTGGTWDHLRWYTVNINFLNAPWYDSCHNTTQQNCFRWS